MGKDYGRTDSFAFYFEIRPNAEKVRCESIGLFLVGEDGFEPSKRNAADLQSVPFGHSGTPPDVQLRMLFAQNFFIITRNEKMSRSLLRNFKNF